MNNNYIVGCFFPSATFLIEKGIHATGLNIVARRGNVYTLEYGDVKLELIWDSSDEIEYGVVEFSLTSANYRSVSDGLLHAVARQIIASDGHGTLRNNFGTYDVDVDDLQDRQTIQQDIVNTLTHII